MKGLAAVLVVAVCSMVPVLALKPGSLFAACQLAPVAGSGSSASGLVACVYTPKDVVSDPSAVPATTNNTVNCAIQYAGLASDVVEATITTAGSGVDLFNFNNIGTANPRTGAFNAGVIETVQASGGSSTWPTYYNAAAGDFASNVSACFGPTYGCKVTLKTQALGSGELACTFGELINGASFAFAIDANKTVAPNSVGNGWVWMDWFVTSADYATSETATSVWAYSVDYRSVQSPVVGAGLYNGGNAFPAITLNPPVIQMDTSLTAQYNLLTGSFSGVAIQRTAFYNFSAYNAATNYDFLKACSQRSCYVGVFTSPPTVMELRGQLSGVAMVLPSLFTIVCVLVAMLN